MGMSPKLLQSAAEQLLLLLGFVSVGLVAMVVPAIRIRIRRPHIPQAWCTGVFLRLAPAFTIVVASALPSHGAVLQRKPRPSWAQASSQVETDGPPPLPSVLPRRMRDSAAAHPAVHPGTRLTGRLFPRAGSPSKTDEDRQRGIDAHPAGKDFLSEEYEVQLGDTLWDIAAQVLKTDDPARIARFWPKLHHANVDVLGADPNRIFPGQVLRLPKERT